MDRLSKALEKARESRVAVLGSGVASGESDGTRIDPIGRGGVAPAIVMRPVSAAHLEASRVVGNGQNDAALRAFKLLRTQVVQRMRENGWQTLVVTSAGRGNGKTVTAINLSVNLARQAHHNVLLADLDLLQPSIHRYLSEEPVPGISDYILGDIDISGILFNPGIDGLTVLPGREPFSHSSEALLSKKTTNLMKDLRALYADGFIVLDMPPLLAVDDVMAFSAHWDAALVVVEDGCTTEADFRRTLGFLKDKPVIGTVLTKSRDALPEYGY